jgi:hypothetical protein
MSYVKYFYRHYKILENSEYLVHRSFDLEDTP